MERLEISCPDCHWHLICDHLAMVRQLTTLGMFRREEEPNADLVVELFRRSAGKLSCGDCSRIGLKVDLPRDDEEEWDQRRVCQVCRQPIPLERLEVFPDADTCVGCREKLDNADDHATPDFCPKCGEIMSLSTSRGGGMTRYKMRCPRCK
ncbi:TraR/DksA C4-type zinc finger protein [Blastopirellula sp. J2-11]|uniref:TraR/DksA C4-type zinc finger protein n=1 Tax=Blastopirellula sp. J2-11 TaxID=2943192 RepID=UPI0021C7AFFA|nr:TraR/DksA C4-type zinc finger protein [Blastopirellula sp. J2-11]UUO09016.1 TraR/DksA C4-type zinc finger protein [Blastopirellula sp. J2-11]